MQFCFYQCFCCTQSPGQARTKTFKLFACAMMVQSLQESSSPVQHYLHEHESGGGGGCAGLVLSGPAFPRRRAGKTINLMVFSSTLCSHVEPACVTSLQSV